MHPAIILFVVAILGSVLLSFVPVEFPYSRPTFFGLGILLGGAVAFFMGRPKAQATRTEDIATVTLYVGNLPYRANEHSVQQTFERFGKVLSVRLMKDRQTGRRRGFGFVEMLTEDAQAAINGLNDQQFQDRTLKVREAKERRDQEEE
ncbi:RNA recognition motif-containing protein [Gallaecimonas pentaromativorans]|uniref:RNA recognition motif-containing protein n=2 Tax=Gallaecimonas pentaromativorans TaxID=584787 RepID=A0A3N1NRZ2_9GAMM|nr:RNA-binding protein [Gallaecimonas pentaromativorans]ROQ18945.1 RNA recognition motif-containing protein [Gallaecimonas pentaromativorans]